MIYPHKFIKEPLFGSVIWVLVDEREAHPTKPLDVDGVSGIYTVEEDQVVL